MNKVDLNHLREWIGRETLAHDTLTVRQARLMAATLGLPQAEFEMGTALPPLWHWIYFLEGFPSAELGRDGHPARGGFLPPVPLANRMWAGGHVQFHAEVPLGAEVKKRSRIQSVAHKEGRSGELVFVTVLHEVMLDDQVVVSETHDIVYKGPTPSGIESTQSDMPRPTQTKLFTPTSTTLFRYSALTFNGHRIHYDVDYCRNVEGYANLVIHGPLNATLLAAYAQEIGGRPLKSFRYRGLRPSLLGNTLSINAAPDDKGLTLWIGLPGAEVSMRAEASF